MKFVFAPDSFKESLSALSLAQILDRVARLHFDGLECVLLPIADGGEGTAEALTQALSGELQTARVFDPLGREISARFGVAGEAAVIELAEASGLHKVMPGERDVMASSTYGFGQLIVAALSQGVKKLYLGLGGSATNDGGMGMLCALGVRFYDDGERALWPSGASLSKIARADLRGLDPRFASAEILAVCDVTNPLLGETGATNIYGPQKGARYEDRAKLEAGMETYARVMEAATGKDARAIPGSGAAGGVGAALYYAANVKMLRGVDAVLDAVNFDEKTRGADLVITGEGRFDGQSALFNKAPMGVARRCAAKGIPVIVLAGSVGGDVEAFYGLPNTSLCPVVPGPIPLEDAMENAERYVEAAADRLFRTLKIGMGLR